jgi:hypothetical protein
MNTNDVIEAYVADVARKLPRRQRNDVALELRELLREGLQDRADAEGRPADAAMATAFLNAFGAPVDVAARYRPVLHIVDPAHSRSFLLASGIGLGVIWLLSLVEVLSHSTHAGWDLLIPIGHWWGKVLLPSMWWPGVLVVGYAIAAWARRRNPQAATWAPRAPDRIEGGRWLLLPGIAGVAVGLYVLRDPHVVLDFAWQGHAAPQAYAALSYTDAFLQRQAWPIFVLLALNIPLLAAAFVAGRWTPALRRIELALSVALSLVMLWAAFDGPVMATAAADGLARALLGLIAVLTLVFHGVQYARRISPAPQQRLQH